MEPILIAEAAINGILLGGVLALLALGLNLIFGVVDIIWIAYVELVMLGMYAVYWLLIIAPILSSPPVNQLLATGGLLFFLQSFATFLWATDHRSLRLALPILEVFGMFLSFARLLAFAVSLLAMLGLYLFLTRTYMGTAIRAVSQDREAMALMGADARKVYLVTSGIGGAMAGLAGALLIIQYSVHPHFGAAFGPLTFMICVLGGLGNMFGAVVASLLMSEVISVGGIITSTEMAYVVAFVIFIVAIFVRPEGILGKRE